MDLQCGSARGDFFWSYSASKRSTSQEPEESCAAFDCWVGKMKKRSPIVSVGLRKAKGSRGAEHRAN